MSDFAKAEQPRRTRRQFLINSSLLGVAAGLGSAGLAACGGGTGTTPKSGSKGAGRQGKSGETLFIAGFQWGPVTTFNPFAQSPGWPSGGNNMQLIYETLLRYNLLSGELEPGLATEVQTPDETTFVLPIQPDAKWSDGKPVTAKDVAYSFELPKRHAELDKSMWDYVDSVTATDEKTVTVKLKAAKLNPGIVKNSLATSWILPEHIWSKYEADKSKKIAEHPNNEPVGSGSFKVEAFNNQQISLVRNDSYWGNTVFGKPAPKYIVHPIFKDNAAGNLALEQGKIDVMQQFTSEIWKMWEDKKRPVATWFAKEPYYVPGSIPMLVVNCQEKGLNDPRVRRAIAFAIDYKDIASKAMSRYSIPANSSIVIPGGGEDKFFDQANVDKNGWKYDPAESERIMKEEVKATKGKDGIWVLQDGTRCGPWKAQTPTGWSDWQAAINIVGTNAKAAGFDIQPNFPDQAAVTDSVNSGNFHFTLWYVTGVGAATPWQRFRDVLEDRGVPKRGQQAFWNYGRFKDAKVGPLIDKLANAKSDDEAKGYITELDTIFMKNAPMIPLMYRPLEFYEFNTMTWTNFPTEKNDYAPPMFQGAGVNWLSKIKRA
ncbi:ABC transporter substrate-binding protein [Flindersiella endophytica]